MFCLAVIPLAAYFMRRRFSLDPWFGAAVGIAAGILVFYAVTAPVAALHADRISLARYPGMRPFRGTCPLRDGRVSDRPSTSHVERRYNAPMANFEEAYARLNDEQQQAVDTIEGPVMVIAGPGTGKTEVLTVRIANILKKTKTPPERILALTFTESGVVAMRRRLSGAGPGRRLSRRRFPRSTVSRTADPGLSGSFSAYRRLGEHHRDRSGADSRKIARRSGARSPAAVRRPILLSAEYSCRHRRTEKTGRFARCVRGDRRERKKGFLRESRSS